MNVAPTPSPDALTLRVHRRLPEAEAAWRQAETALAGYAFQTFDWVASYLETLGAATGTEACVVTATDPATGRVLGLWPLGILRRRGLRELVFLGRNVSDYHAPLLDPALAGLDAGAFARLWGRILKALPPVDVVRLWLMPETLDGAHGGPVPNPMVGLPGAEMVEVAESATLPESFEAFQKRLKTRFVADTRRLFRRMGEVGPVRLDVVEDPAGKRRAVDALMRLKSQRWVETKVPDWSTVPGFKAFYETMAERSPGDGQIHVSNLVVGETLVATHWGIVFRRRFYYLMLGWEGGDWRARSPGRLLVDRLIEWSIDHGVKNFDCTVGNEDYKQNWVDTRLDLYSLTAPVSARGRLALALEGGVDELRERAKKLKWLRRLVRRAMGRAELKEGATENPAGRRH